MDQRRSCSEAPPGQPTADQHNLGAGRPDGEEFAEGQSQDSLGGRFPPGQWKGGGGGCVLAGWGIWNGECILTSPPLGGAASMAAYSGITNKRLRTHAL